MTGPDHPSPDRGPEPDLDPGPGQGPPEEPDNHLRTTGPGPLVGTGLVGLVVGWSIRPLSIRSGRVAPAVPPVSVALIFFAAAIVALAAYYTWRIVHRDHHRLPIHHGVNRLLLAKASAVVGALVVGGYLGNAIAHTGVGEGYAQSQVWWSLAAAAGGAALTVAALLLERACRVPKAKP